MDTPLYANHDFKIVKVDTDAISFCKADQTFFSAQERSDLLKELNSLFLEKIKFEDEGYYKKIVVIKTKNYILWDGARIKYKGSALRAPTLEPALKEFIKRIIDMIIAGETHYTEVYHEYVREIHNVTDIKRWASRKTITSKVLKSDRTTEKKVREAIEGSDYREGDRAYFFFKPDDSLCLAERFTGEYNRARLYEKLHNVTERFSTVLDTGSLFKNYKLKRNLEHLNAVISTSG